MPRGHPDYQSSREPAIALQTVLKDDFEGPTLIWRVVSSGASADPILSLTRGWIGTQVVLFTIVAGVGEFSRLWKLFPLLSLDKIGVEFFYYQPVPLSSEMVVRINTSDGTNISQAELRLDAAARNATIVTPAGNRIVATNCFNTPFNQTYQPFKLVIDIRNDTYVKLLCGPDDIPLSAHLLVPGGLTNDRMIEVRFSLESAAGNAEASRLDNFILSQNEP